MGDDDGNLPAARQACDDAYEAYTAYALWWTSFAAYLIAMGLTLFAHFSKDLCGCHHKFDQKVFRLFVGSALFLGAVFASAALGTHDNSVAKPSMCGYEVTLNDE